MNDYVASTGSYQIVHSDIPKTCRIYQERIRVVLSWEVKYHIPAHLHDCVFGSEGELSTYLFSYIKDGSGARHGHWESLVQDEDGDLYLPAPPPAMEEDIEEYFADSKVRITES